MLTLGAHFAPCQIRLAFILETVSRTFSKFQDEGLISVQQKHIRIVDIRGLKKAMGQADVANC